MCVTLPYWVWGNYVQIMCLEYDELEQMKTFIFDFKICIVGKILILVGIYIFWTSLSETQKHEYTKNIIYRKKKERS